MRIAPRFFAAVLMLLIVLPFTAPFASCDFSSLVGEVAATQGQVDVKTMKDEATAGFVPLLVGQLAPDAVLDPVGVPESADSRPLPLAVLRV